MLYRASCSRCNNNWQASEQASISCCIELKLAMYVCIMCVYMYVCVYVCIYVCMCIYVWMCIYVTGSAKRYTNAQAMIFLYKRCSKTRNIFYSLKKNFGGA